MRRDNSDVLNCVDMAGLGFCFLTIVGIFMFPIVYYVYHNGITKVVCGIFIGLILLVLLYILCYWIGKFAISFFKEYL